MLRTLLCLLLAATAAPAAIEVIKVPGADDLHEPFSLAFDAHGDAYGVEFQPANRIFKLHAGRIEYVSGVRWDSAPKGKLPPAPAKRLDLAPAVYDGMHDIAVGPDGSIYAADSFQHRIIRLDPKTHAATVFAGTGKAGFSGDGGPADQAQLNIPMCGVIDPSGKSMVIADLVNQRVRRIDLATKVITTIAGNGSSEFRALRLSAQGWQPVANATGLVSSARVSPFAAPRLLMDTQNRPVAGLAIGNSGGVQLAMLDNGQWRAPSDTTRGADRFDGEYFDITAENNGRIYLATAPRSGNGTVVGRFTPTPAPGVWETVGPNGGLLPQPADERSAFAPRIAIDANGNAMVAGSSQRFTAVWRFNGTSWTNGAASRPSANNFAGFLTGFALLGPRALMAHVDTLATSNGSVPRPVLQANDAADVTTGLGPHAGAVPQFTATFAFNRSGQNGRLLNLGGTVYQAIQNGSTQVQVLRLTE